MGRPCCGVRVKFRYLDIETVTRQRRVSSSVDEVILYAVALQLAGVLRVRVDARCPIIHTLGE